jgi:hypothetical protein
LLELFDQAHAPIKAIPAAPAKTERAARTRTIADRFAHQARQPSTAKEISGEKFDQ